MTFNPSTNIAQPYTNHIRFTQEKYDDLLFSDVGAVGTLIVKQLINGIKNLSINIYPIEE